MLECESCLWSPPSPRNGARSNPTFAVWDHKILCEDCFHLETDAYFDDFVKMGTYMSEKQQVAAAKNKSRFRVRISPQTRERLHDIGWTSDIVGHLLNACERDSNACYEMNMTRIRILAKPSSNIIAGGPQRTIKGCDCTPCAIAVSDGVESFIANKWGRKAYTPVTFMRHSLGWSDEEIESFLREF